MLSLKIRKAINIAFRAIGYALIVAGFFMLVVGFAILVEGKTTDGPGIIIISLIFFIPAWIILFFEKRSRREIELLEILTGAIISYRRIKIEDLSQKLSIPHHHTEKLLMKAIQCGLIEGSFDRTMGEFVLKDAEKLAVGYRFCPNCGSPFEKIYLIGETVKCSRCGMIIHTKEASHGN
ncbi:MAG: PCI domain-containing protein [Spirochaetes bacterium]|nr:PCI domain-containing protein [Spirochaetota bacterium]